MLTLLMSAQTNILGGIMAKYKLKRNQNFKDSALARGENIANAFSNPASPNYTESNNYDGKTNYKEEYALGSSDNIALKRMKRQKDTENVEFAKEVPCCEKNKKK